MQYIEKINKNIVLICLLFVITSISFSLINEKISRIPFFIAAYLSIVGILFDKKNYKKYLKSVPIFLFLFGISKVLWFYLFRISYHIDSEIDMYNGYLQSGKRIILCSIIISYLLINLNNVNYNRKFIGISLFISFILSSIYAIYQIIDQIPRVEFYTVATGAAYMYGCLTMVLIAFLLNLEMKKKYLYTLITIIFILSMFVIFKTGTRAAIIFQPILLLVVLFMSNLNNKHKVILLFAFLTTIISSFYIFNSEITAKIDQTITEIIIHKESNGNHASSLGNRFSMWNTGIHSFIQHPLGTTMKQRNQTIEEYVNTEGKHRAALQHTYIHLHNELIDTLTLQGIIGGLILLIFYFSLLYKSIKEKNLMLLSVMLCLIVYGLTDVLFINRALSLFFCLMIIASLLLHKNHQPKIS